MVNTALAIFICFLSAGVLIGFVMIVNILWTVHSNIVNIAKANNININIVYSLLVQSQSDNYIIRESAQKTLDSMEDICSKVKND